MPDEGPEPRRVGDGWGTDGVGEAGEESAGSGSSKRAESGREMRNTIFFISTMR